ncbi:hypothetical protein NLM27_26130 [Bradyrhizobium sp. CCGB12]|uniref:hypothetical protein n=1 Tax=Bradyrhizobium sp. CCGB12 TaxID=2949632 RepID=UPI0020B3896D|nr:hypothetical protein [Bradyrhizobium sp. CCGB12]MCP3392246.1 hypothetical protein [Bradyrhizobium sp. CCGB12]
MQQARGEADVSKREMYGEMQRLVHESSGICIPVFRSYFDAHEANVKGLRPISLGPLMGYNFAESVCVEQ